MWHREIRTDVVRVEGVDADEGANGQGPDSPAGNWTERGELAVVEVVGQDLVEPLCAEKLPL